MKTTKLSVEEREKIFYYLTLNKSCREIGIQLGRSHTTISREIKRNKTEWEYSASKNLSKSMQMHKIILTR